MTGPNVAASLLERARRAKDSLDARILLAAAVNRVALEIGARAVVSGGTAVDFYAAGATGTSESYPVKWAPSGDVDLVVLHVDGYQSVAPLLRKALDEKLGLRPRYAGVPRAIEVPDFAYGLDIFGGELHGDPRADRVVTILVDDLHPVHVRGPEDIILVYAESGWDTRHTRDWERALAVFSAMRDRLDLAWMHAEAERRQLRHVLDAIVELRPSPWLPRREAPG